ncbi:amino acid adenylation domain-containing protein [Kitasatospora sp. NPDC059648]|uniref:amino acid adenylation domain-containing protein n=1 Tax=Kitasatospora sp. NPDC059648 TaxID=3346894 RepID=UPI003695C162
MNAETVSLHELVDQQADREPDALAVVVDGEELTYAKLVDDSRRLAADLRDRGVAEEHVVALDLPVGPRLVAAMLAAGRLGAAFLPLDQRDPRARRDYLLADAKPAAVVTADDVLVPETAPEKLSDRLPRVASPAAYLSYTSGSTGEPKGVVTEQHAIVNYVRAAIAEYRLTPADRQLQFASIAFDIAMDEVFSTLVAGATLVLRGEDFVYEDAEDFLRLLDKRGVTVANLPTGIWNQFGLALRQTPRVSLPAALRIMVVGGEAAGADAAAAWHAASVADGFRVVNAYGPTEAAVSVSFAELTADGPVTIGRGIANVGLTPVGEDLLPVPAGEIGELLVTGVAPARGYLDRPEHTAARFGENAEGRYYRTGDLGRVRPDGLIEFHGRADEQVKVRGGFRVEPGEVVRVLLAHPGVADAVVLPVDQGAGRVLAAFVVAAADGGPQDAELREHLGSRLPDYMVPGSFTRIETIPLTARGKVDAAALTALLAAPASQPTAAPGTPEAVENAVREAWTLAVGVEPEDDDADFFDEGADSIGAVEFLKQLRARLGVAPALRALYASPRFGDVVELLARGDGVAPADR